MSHFFQALFLLPTFLIPTHIPEPKHVLKESAFRAHLVQHSALTDWPT